MFEPKKFNDIFDAMRLKTLETGVLSDFEVGSVTRTLQESFAWEMAALYEKMNLVYLSAFVDTAQGGHLDQVVSILGIKRGEPDFAVGKVVFERDKGEEDLPIPAGTLVSTEDSPEMPKKVYKTTEAAVLGKGQQTVEVAVQALVAGDGQEAQPDTITIMPRPVPGVKGVLNPTNILLVGKTAETDDELRRRAKNTLLASGKATATAIEHALLSLPVVTDVQIREDFQFAQGRIRVTRKAGIVGDINIPAGEQVELTAGTQKTVYKTLDAFTIPAGQQEIIMDIRSVVEGPAGEYRGNFFNQLISWRFLDPSNPALNTQVGIALAAGTGTGVLPQIVPGNFGVVRVFVDGPNLSDPSTDAYKKAIATVRTELDRVRAAGVYPILESARPVWADMALLVDLDAGLKPTEAERTDLENRAREAVVDYFRQLRMENPLIYAKLLRVLTDLDGIDNLAELRITTTTPRAGLSSVVQIENKPFNKIAVDSFERMLPRDICVATEPKTLLFDYEFDLTSPGTPAQEEAKFLTIRNAVQAQFPAKAGDPIALLAQPDGSAPKKIAVRTWCKRTSLPEFPAAGTAIQPLFFERGALGILFVYFRTLEITGAMRLTLLPTLNKDGQEKAVTAVKKVADDYLDALAPETPVLLEDLQTLIAAVPEVEAVEIDADDFRLSLSNAPANDRLNAAKKRIDVRKFEKVRLRPNNFLIATGRTNLTVTVSALTLKLFQRRDTANAVIALTPAEIAAVKNAVLLAVNSYLNAAEMGADISFNDFKSSLEGLAVGVGYALEFFSISATSADGRLQSANLTAPLDIHVRSPELPVIAPIVLATIQHTLG